MIKIGFERNMVIFIENYQNEPNLYAYCDSAFAKRVGKQKNPIPKGERQTREDDWEEELKI